MKGEGSASVRSERAETPIKDTLGLFKGSAQARSLPISPAVLARWTWIKLLEAAERFEKERQAAKRLEPSLRFEKVLRFDKALRQAKQKGS